MLDLLLIAVVRGWFAGNLSEAPGWYAAYGDPVVGPALRLLHHSPARPWTVAASARQIGVCARRSPAGFTSWSASRRCGSSASGASRSPRDLLLEPGATVGSVAHEVGYGTPYALSTAFKRLRGVSPKSIARPCSAA